jgi:hypothetical protein
MKLEKKNRFRKKGKKTTIERNSILWGGAQ